MQYALLLAAVTVCGCGGRRDGGLSDREAGKLLEAALFEGGTLLPLGAIKFLRTNPIENRKPNPSKGEVSVDYLKWYEALQAEGTVSVSRRVDLSNSRNFSWSNWMSLTQDGVQVRATAARTDEGKGRHQCAAGRLQEIGLADALCVSQGSGRIEEIVRGELFQGDTRQYYFFMGNYRWKWTPLMIELGVAGAGFKDKMEERKFMAVAGFDPFLKKWSLYREDCDTAPRSSPFPNQAKFDRFIGSLRAATKTGASSR